MNARKPSNAATPADLGIAAARADASSRPAHVVRAGGPRDRVAPVLERTVEILGGEVRLLGDNADALDYVRDAAILREDLVQALKDTVARLRRLDARLLGSAAECEIGEVRAARRVLLRAGASL